MDGYEARKKWKDQKKSLMPKRVRRIKAVNVEDYVATEESVDQDDLTVHVKIRKKLVKFITEEKES